MQIKYIFIITLSTKKRVILLQGSQTIQLLYHNLGDSMELQIFERTPLSRNLAITLLPVMLSCCENLFNELGDYQGVSASSPSPLLSELYEPTNIGRISVMYSMAIVRPNEPYQERRFPADSFN